MITEEKLEKMYTAIAKKNQISTKGLIVCGFAKHDISKLVRTGMIGRIKRGTYQCLSVDDLLYFGEEAIADSNWNRAKRYFEMAYDIDKNDPTICYRLFVREIHAGNFQQAISYLDQIYLLDPCFYDPYINIYLRLMSNLVVLPKKYFDLVRKMRPNNIRVQLESTNPSILSLEGLLNKSVYEFHFDKTATLLRQFFDNSLEINEHNIVLASLNYKCLSEGRKVNNFISDLVKNQQFDEAFDYLSTIKKEKRLSFYSNYMLRYLEDLKLVMLTGGLSQSNKDRIKPYLEKRKQDLLRRNMEVSNDALCLLLTKIHYEIENGFPTYHENLQASRQSQISQQYVKK